MNTITILERKEINATYSNIYNLYYDYDSPELLDVLIANGFSYSNAHEILEIIYNGDQIYSEGIYVNNLYETFSSMSDLGEYAKMKLEEDPDNISYIIQYTTEPAVLFEYSDNYIRMDFDHFESLVNKFIKAMEGQKEEIEDWANEEHDYDHFNYFYYARYFYSEINTANEEDGKVYNDTLNYYKKEKEFYKLDAKIPNKKEVTKKNKI